MFMVVTVTAATNSLSIGKKTVISVVTRSFSLTGSSRVSKRPSKKLFCLLKYEFIYTIYNANKPNGNTTELIVRQKAIKELRFSV